MGRSAGIGVPYVVFPTHRRRLLIETRCQGLESIDALRLAGKEPQTALGQIRHKEQADRPA
jgi:hypothetical protein